MTTWKIEHWCKTIEDVDALMSLPFVPLNYDFSDYARIQKETGDKGIIMSSLGDPVCMAMELMEFGEATVWALTEPEHFKATLDELHRREIINLRSMLEQERVDIYRICGPEYVTPPYLSPKHFKQFVYPYLCDMVALIHEYGKKVRIHSHGRIGQVLDMIIDTGADAIDPCEAPPDGDITLAAIKQKTGNRMAIFGNLQLKLLEHGTDREVREAVKECMCAAKDGGNYVIMPTASPINLPLSKKTADNYQIFIETALELGSY
jgi:uroporphyrinogen decarboxylase